MKNSNIEIFKIINFIETYYHRQLNEDEIIAIKSELSDYTYDRFIRTIKEPLLLSTKYFTISDLYRVVEYKRKSDDYLALSNIDSWEELYDN